MDNRSENRRQTFPWQAQQRTRLTSQYSAGKVPHALLFSGLEGLGKKQFAYFFSALMFCENPSAQYTPCGECKQCKLFDSDTHPDFKFVEPDKSKKSTVITINQIRQLAEFFNKSGLQGGPKVAILSPAELLNNAAANALLKTLEEPSSQSVIILICDQPGMLLPTIRSRCQVIEFTQPSASESLAWLKINCDHAEEQQITSDAELAEVLSLAHSSPLKAKHYLQMGALKEYRLMLSEMGRFLKNDVLSSTLATRWGDELAPLRVAWMAHWLELILRIKLNAVEHVIAPAESGDVTDNDERPAQKMFNYLSEKASHTELFGLHTSCLAQYRLFLGKTNPNKILAFESLLHKWSALMRKH